VLQRGLAPFGRGRGIRLHGERLHSMAPTYSQVETRRGLPNGLFRDLLENYNIHNRARNTAAIYSYECREDAIYDRRKGEKLLSFYDRGYANKVCNLQTNLEFEAYKLGRKVAAIKEVLDRDFYATGMRSILEGPSVAKELKKGRQYGFLNSFQDKRESYKDDQGSNERLDNYDDQFPYEDLFPWKEDDPLDIKKSFEPCKPKQRALDFFRTCFREILNEAGDLTWNDEIMKILASKGGTSASYSKEKFRGYSKIINGTKSSKVMKCRRSVIRVHPANVRDSVVLDAESANSVAMCSYFLQQIIYPLPESIMSESADQEARKLRRSIRAFKKHGYSYTRDFRKDGLTKPKQLIKIIHEELQKKYFTVDLDCFYALYNQSIELDVDIQGVGKAGDKLDPPRGHSLGMGNELTTLVQVIISRMVKKSFLPSEDYTVDVWNDDFRCHGCREDLAAYRIIDLQICKDLDYPLSMEKTRILDGATVFLEEYTFEKEDIAYRKECRKVCNIVEILFARNIYEAKQLSRSIYETLNEFFIDNVNASKLYMTCISNWGYELHRAEIILPDIFGGWYTCTYCYLNEALVLRSTGETSPRVLKKLFEAEKVNVSLHRKKTYAFSNYSSRKLKNPRELDKIERIIAPHGDIIMYNLKSIADMTEKGLHRSRLSDLYYSLQLKERLKAYNTDYPEISREKVYEEVLDEHDLKCFAIPIQYCDPCYNYVEDETYTSFRVEGSSLVDDIGLEWKYLNNQELTLREKCRLISKTKLICSPNGRHTETVSIPKDLVDRSVLKYYNNYHYMLLYYHYEYNFIPKRFYMKLPDRFVKYNITDQEFDYITEIRDSFPKKLDATSANNLDWFARVTNLPMETLVTVYKALSTAIGIVEDNDMKGYRIIVNKTRDVDRLFDMIYETPLEENTPDHNDIACHKEEPVTGEIQFTFDMKAFMEECEERSQATPEEAEFVYEYHDHISWGSDDDYLDMEAELYYGST
jgi:hypothetical protein